MVKAVILNGSPNNEGNTMEITMEFVKGLKEKNAEVEIINAYNEEIYPCNGCMSCKKLGKCVIRDDMDSVVDKIENSDIIVLSSPVYFAGFTAPLKMIIDRFQVMYSKKYLLKCENIKKKQGYLIFTAGGNNKKVIDSMELSSKFFFLSCNALFIKSIYLLSTDYKPNNKNDVYIDTYAQGILAVDNLF